MKYEINKLSILERNNVFKDKSDGEFAIMNYSVLLNAMPNFENKENILMLQPLSILNRKLNRTIYIGLALGCCVGSLFILKTFGFGTVIEQINGAGN